MTKILAALLVAATAAVALMYGRVRTLTEERDRYRDNQQALIYRMNRYKTESGLNAASAQKLVLSYDELKESYETVRRSAEELGIKLRRIESAATSATETSVKVVTEVRDSVVVRDSAVAVLTAFDWRDAWTDVRGVIDGRDVDMDIVSRDTLVQIVHRVPHKFWFIKWGTKAIRQEILSRNPHTEIQYTEYIELKK